MIIKISVGMQVRLRKVHACGRDTWKISRAGADVGLVCDGCGRRVMLEREDFERRVRQILPIPTPSESGEKIHEFNPEDVTDITIK